jgi:hypothetical protein
MYEPENENEAWMTDTGRKFAKILKLKKKVDGRYNTAWGDKTALGIYLMIVNMAKCK